MLHLANIGNITMDKCVYFYELMSVLNYNASIVDIIMLILT